MFLEILFYPLAGFFMKISDDAQDKRNNRIIGIITGIICVLAIGYLVVKSGDAAAIFLGIMIGSLLAGKVDRIGHIITLIFFFAILAIFGIPQIGLVSLVLCVFAAYLDELGNDSIWSRRSHFLTVFFKYRFALKIVVFLLSLGGLLQSFLVQIPGLIFFQPETFILFIMFDIAYELAGLYFDTIYDGFDRRLGFAR